MDLEKCVRQTIDKPFQQVFGLNAKLPQSSSTQKAKASYSTFVINASQQANNTS